MAEPTDEVKNLESWACDKGNPLCDNVTENNPFEFLPMWRWTWVSDIWSNWDTGGAFDFVKKIVAGTLSVSMEVLFLLASFLWEITSSALYLLLNLEFWSGLESQVGLQSYNIMKGLGFGTGDAVLWAGIGVIAVFVFAWRMSRAETRGGAVQNLLGTLVLLGAVGAIFQATQAEVADNNNWGSEPGSTVWIHNFIETPLDELSEIIVETGDNITQNVRSESSTYCDSYIAALENLYRGARLARNPKLSKAQLEVPVALSRMWIATHLTAYGGAQFGDGSLGRRGGCLLAEKQRSNAHDILAIWDFTCYGRTVKNPPQFVTPEPPSGTAPTTGARGGAAGGKHAVLNETDNNFIYGHWIWEGGAYDGTSEGASVNWSSMSSLFGCMHNRAYGFTSERAANNVFKAPRWEQDTGYERAILTILSNCEYMDPRLAFNDWSRRPTMANPRTFQNAMLDAGYEADQASQPGAWLSPQDVYSDVDTQGMEQDAPAENIFMTLHGISPEGQLQWVWVNMDVRHLGGIDGGKQDDEFLDAKVCAKFMVGNDHENLNVDDLTDGTNKDTDLLIGKDGSGLNDWVKDRGNFNLNNIGELIEDRTAALVANGGSPIPYNTTLTELHTYPSAEEMDRAVAGFERLHGRNDIVGRFMLAGMAIITAAIYMLSLIGLAAGAILSKFILAIVFTTLPLILLVAALPIRAGRSLIRKTFFLTVGAFLAYATFYTVLVLVTVLVTILGDGIASVTEQGSWQRSLGMAAIPLVAIKAVGWLFKSFGFNITSFRGALAVTSGMAAASLQPTALDKGAAYAKNKFRQAQNAAGMMAMYGGAPQNLSPPEPRGGSGTGTPGGDASGTGTSGGDVYGMASGESGGTNGSGGTKTKAKTKNRMSDGPQLGNLGGSMGVASGAGSSSADTAFGGTILGGGGAGGVAGAAGAPARWLKGGFDKGKAAYKTVQAAKDSISAKAEQGAWLMKRHRRKIQIAGLAGAALIGGAAIAAPVLAGLLAGKFIYRKVVPRGIRYRNKQMLKRHKQGKREKRMKDRAKAKESIDKNTTPPPGSEKGGKDGPDPWGDDDNPERQSDSQSDFYDWQSETAQADTEQAGPTESTLHGGRTYERSEGGLFVPTLSNEREREDSSTLDTDADQQRRRVEENATPPEMPEINVGSASTQAEGGGQGQTDTLPDGSPWPDNPDYGVDADRQQQVWMDPNTGELRTASGDAPPIRPPDTTTPPGPVVPQGEAPQNEGGRTEVIQEAPQTEVRQQTVETTQTEAGQQQVPTYPPPPPPPPPPSDPPSGGGGAAVTPEPRPNPTAPAQQAVERGRPPGGRSAEERQPPNTRADDPRRSRSDQRNTGGQKRTADNTAPRRTPPTPEVPQQQPADPAQPQPENRQQETAPRKPAPQPVQQQPQPQTQQPRQTTPRQEQQPRQQQPQPQTRQQEQRREKPQTRQSQNRQSEQTQQPQQAPSRRSQQQTPPQQQAEPQPKPQPQTRQPQPQQQAQPKPQPQQQPQSQTRQPQPKPQPQQQPPPKPQPQQQPPPRPEQQRQPRYRADGDQTQAGDQGRRSGGRRNVRSSDTDSGGAQDRRGAARPAPQPEQPPKQEP